jgi:hypothetical protein
MTLLTKNFWLKLASLLAACVVWYSMTNQPDLATILSAPVQFRNYPRDLEISSEIVESINIEARGPANRLRELRDSRLSAIIDFATVKAPGERTFTLTAREIKLPRGVELVRTIPAQLRFTFERGARRPLKVEVPFSGELPAGYTVSKVEVFPPALEIAGPESRVMSAKNAVSDPFDLGMVKVDGSGGEAQEHLSVFNEEAEVRFVTPPQVTVKVRVQKTH